MIQSPDNYTFSTFSQKELKHTIPVLLPIPRQGNLSTQMTSNVHGAGKGIIKKCSNSKLSEGYDQMYKIKIFQVGLTHPLRKYCSAHIL